MFASQAGGPRVCPEMPSRVVAAGKLLKRLDNSVRQFCLTSLLQRIRFKGTVQAKGNFAEEEHSTR